MISKDPEHLVKDADKEKLDQFFEFLKSRGELDLLAFSLQKRSDQELYATYLAPQAKHPIRLAPGLLDEIRLAAASSASPEFFAQLIRLAKSEAGKQLISVSLPDFHESYETRKNRSHTEHDYLNSSLITESAELTRKCLSSFMKAD